MCRWEIKGWIRSLSGLIDLSCSFSVPVIVLEPIKPIAAYLAATGQFLSGALTFIFGELLKLVLVERLFSLTREKLMIFLPLRNCMDGIARPSLG